MTNMRYEYSVNESNCFKLFLCSAAMLKKDRKKTKPTRRGRRGGSEEANKQLATFLQRREEAQESRMARKRVNEADGEKRKAALTVLLQLPLLSTPYQCREPMIKDKDCRVGQLTRNLATSDCQRIIDGYWVPMILSLSVIRDRCCW